MEMDAATQMLEFPQFRPIECRANAEAAHRAIGATALFGSLATKEIFMRHPG